MKLNMEAKNKPFRVLCLDGGGMRGLYTASVLSTLASRFSPTQQLDVGKGFNLISGTSTGGILACALASGISISKVIDIYKNHGSKIFTHPIPTNIFLKIFWAFRNISHPANRSEHLRSCLEEIFGTQTFGELYTQRGIGLCIPTINLATHEPRVFKTRHDPKRNADDERRLVDVCLATSAAPIILPIACIENPHGWNQISHFVDGGLWANNPVLIGLIEALQISEKDQEIEIVSIGTCPPPSGGALLPKEAARGLFGWNFGIKALELSMDAQTSGHQFMAKFLIEYIQRCGRKINLFRFEQSAPSSEQSYYLGLDNASERACSTLFELGNSDALKCYGKTLNENNPCSILRPIFQSMPSLKC